MRCFFGWDHEGARVGATGWHANHYVIATKVANEMFVDERAKALGQVGVIRIVEGRLDFLGVKVERTIAQYEPVLGVDRHDFDACLTNVETDDWFVAIK